MKLIFLASSLLTALSLSVPLPESAWHVRQAGDSETVTFVDLDVTFDELPGVVFKGTAESIVAQISKSNLDLLTKPNVTSAVVDLEERGLEKRESINCNWDAKLPNFKPCQDGLTYLYQLSGDAAWCGVNGPMHNCARVSCSRNCGMYLCNRTGTYLRVMCKDIARDTEYLGRVCSKIPLLGQTREVAGCMDFEDHYTGFARPHNGC